MAQKSCLDGNADYRNFGKSIITYPCHQQGGNQVKMIYP